MSKTVKWVIAGSILGLIAILTISIIGYNWNVDNKLKDNKNLFIAQYDVCKISHDEMTKIIKQTANVTDHFMEKYGDNVIAELVKGRESKGEVMRWITEDNPEFNGDVLYEKLMNNIEVERIKFSRAQTRAVDIRKEIMNMIENKPQCVFVDDKYKEYIIIDGKKVYADEQVQLIYSYKPVTSSASEKAFETGIDDNTDVF
jgi:hypothetical protein